MTLGASLHQSPAGSLDYIYSHVCVCLCFILYLSAVGQYIKVKYQRLHFSVLFTKKGS